MKVVFRTDSSVDIGSGHLMRCLTLAGEMQASGATCFFICRSQSGSLSRLVMDQGFDVFELDENDFIAPEKNTELISSWGNHVCYDWHRDAMLTKKIVIEIRPDWLIVDHYSLDYRWESFLRSSATNLMVIDDLANRKHECDLLLDQNFYADLQLRYLNLVPPACELLLGTFYTLLRKEFTSKRLTLRRRDGEVRRILIFFGGSDHTNQTENALRAIKFLNLEGILVDVVVGKSNPHILALRRLSESMENVILHCQISNMAELIAAADLGIGAGGSAMWERCYLGLPTITVAFADNQVQAAEDAAMLGAVKFLGRCNLFTPNDYALAIKSFIDSPEERKQMENIAFDIVRSGVMNVVEAIKKFSSDALSRKIKT